MRRNPRRGPSPAAGRPAGAATTVSSLSAGALVVITLVALGTLAAVISLGVIISNNTAATRRAVDSLMLDNVTVTAQMSGLEINNEIAAGRVPGTVAIFEFGRNPSVGAVSETIWTGGGLYPFLDVGEPLEIVSSSLNDDAAGGTGARTVRLFGIGANDLELIEDVDLSGTTPVQTVGSFLRIPRLIVVTAGSGRTNEGTITVATVNTATMQGIMSPGTSTTQAGFYSIPSNKESFMTSFTAAVESAGGNGRMHIEYYSRSRNVTTLKGDWSLEDRGTTSFQQNFEVSFYCGPSQDIEFRATSTSAGAVISIYFVILIKDI